MRILLGQVLLWLSLFVCIISFSQPVSLSKSSNEQVGGRNNFKTYSIEEGLPHSNVYCIFQDARGYLWLGTGGGLSRFDGKNFKTFNKKSGLAGNMVRAIMEDSQDRLWIGTDEGISLYDGLKFTTINREDSLSGSTVLSLYEDSKQNIWAGTDDGGLNKITWINNDSIAIQNITPDDGLSSPTIFGIYEDKSGRLWLSTLYGGINILTFSEDDVQIEVLRSGDIPSNVVLCMAEDGKGNLWFGTYDVGVFKIENIGEESERNVITYEALNSGQVWDIFPARDGSLWLATGERGVIRFDGTGFVTYAEQQGVPTTQIATVIQDNEGNIWLGTNGKGLCRFIGEHFAHYTKKDGLLSDIVQAIQQDSLGNYWLATDGGGISVLNFNNGEPVFRHFTEENGFPSNYTTSIAIGKGGNNNIWIATTKNGIVKFDGKKFVNLTEQDGLQDNRVNSILVDAKGVVWCGTANGISKYDGAEFKNASMEKLIMSDEGIKTIIEDKQGNIWFGTVGGLAKYGGNDSITTYDEVEGLNDKDVNAITEGPQGNIWIGTNGGGLYMFDVHTDDTISIRFVVDDSLLSSNSVNSLVFSAPGRQDEQILILGNDKGFDRITFDESWKIIKVRNYNSSDGFIGLECSDNAIFSDNQGNIWFGTVKGLTRYAPAVESKGEDPPVTHITGINLFFKEVDWEKKMGSVAPWFDLPQSLVLPYSENHLTFHFSGISLSNPEKVLYKYMLEGQSEEWSPLMKENKITFSGLTPGDYTFKIKAVNAKGIWNTEPTTFSFAISPPWYQSTWFYILCVVVITISVYIYIKVRERKLQREKRVLEEKVEERTREVVKQKDEIEGQKEEIEEKNKDIMDSINYAKRIQEAILPKDEEREKMLKDSFVLFKPKDVVSGDFYWMAKRDDKVLITAADCTGHGVPGAFMSMIGAALLNEAVNEKGITRPGEVLNEVRSGIIKSLQQTGAEGESKDGMDAALCVLNKDGNLLSFAGANNPIYIIRKKGKPPKDKEGQALEPNIEENGLKLYEIKADKQPVGYYTEEPEPFTSHDIDLFKGDIVYIFSDGFADQFGGPKGKKFKYKSFKELLLTIYEKTMQQQEEILDKTIEDWKAHSDPEGGTYEQIDDILVIGVRL